MRCILPNGLLYTVAGNGTLGFSGDGGPATSAQLGGPTALVVGVNSTATPVRNDNPAKNPPQGDIFDYTDYDLSAMLDLSAALFVADTLNNRLRRVDVSQWASVALTMQPPPSPPLSVLPDPPPASSPPPFSSPVLHPPPSAIPPPPNLSRCVCSHQELYLTRLT